MKYNSLESLRGLAAIAVAMFHTRFVVSTKYSIFAQGEIYVDFFFILSGFVMASAYLSKIQQGLRFKKYITLRFGRLYPLHLFMLFMWLLYVLGKGYAYHRLGMGVGTAPDPFENNTLYTFVSNVFLTNALGIHDSLSWNAVAWSISVEFYVYIVFFLLIFASKSRYKPIHSLLVSALSYAILYKASDTSLLSTYELGFVRGVGGFFLGTFLHHLSKNHAVSMNTVISSLLELIVTAISIYLVINSHESKEYQMMTFITFAVLIYLFTIQDVGVLSRILNIKPMIFIGRLSYSIYMVHTLVIAGFVITWMFVLKLPTSLPGQEGAIDSGLIYTQYANLINLGILVCVIGVSYLTYTFIEKPWRDKFRAIAGHTPQSTPPNPDLTR